MIEKMLKKEKFMEVIESIIVFFIFLTLIAWFPMAITVLIWIFFFTITLATKLLIVATIVMYIQ